MSYSPREMFGRIVDRCDADGTTVNTAMKSRGICPKVVYRLGSGATALGPRVDTVVDIADALGVSLDWLVLGKGEA